MIFVGFLFVRVRLFLIVFFLFLFGGLELYAKRLSILGVDGITNIGGAFTNTGSTTLSNAKIGTLQVTNQTNLNSLTTTSSLLVGDVLTTSGSTTILSTLGVAGVTNIGGALTITGSATCTSNLDVAGVATINTALISTGILSANGPASFDADASFSRSIIQGSTSLVKISGQGALSSSIGSIPMNAFTIVYTTTLGNALINLSLIGDSGAGPIEYRGAYSLSSLDGYSFATTETTVAASGGELKIKAVFIGQPNLTILQFFCDVDIIVNPFVYYDVIGTRITGISFE